MKYRVNYLGTEVILKVEKIENFDYDGKKWIDLHLQNGGHAYYIKRLVKMRKVI